MKFNDYKYERPDFEKVKKQFLEKTEEFKNADSKRQIEIIYEVENINKDFDTMATLASIRNSINTVDEFYEIEQEIFNNESPILMEYANNFNLAVYQSKYKDELVKEFGELIFKKIETELKSFSPEIIENLQEENRLVTEYSKLTASAKINFDGKVLNLSQMKPYTESLDREVRRNAEAAVSNFFKENEEKYDEIYDKLVKERDTMAKKLGYENYIELGYYRLGRTDYDANMVANYRKQILESVVPLAKKLYLEAAKRIGVDKPYSYDFSLEFKDGNPTPKGNCEQLVNKAITMYSELSKETKEFFNFMTSHDLLDLESKKGKQGGGYCTYIANYKSPFIFANFNGTSHDVNVLTHEAGHAFQVYSSAPLAKLSNYIWPTLEACEIHSMSMEFFTWPWLELFFENDAQKYRYSHLVSTITFIPYGALVDDFQHEVYQNPNMSKEERKACFRRLEKMYLPHKIYENEFLDKGTYWYRQGHIFSSPFYYIDYTLAQVCAQQFWVKNNIDHKSAWKDYYNLCLAGGSKSFLNLLELANLNNPFMDGTVKNTIIHLEKWIEENKID